jgi:hypothetical protein
MQWKRYNRRHRYNHISLCPSLSSPLVSSLHFSKKYCYTIKTEDKFVNASPSTAREQKRARTIPRTAIGDKTRRDEKRRRRSQSEETKTKRRRRAGGRAGKKWKFYRRTSKKNSTYLLKKTKKKRAK